MTNKEAFQVVVENTKTNFSQLGEKAKPYVEKAHESAKQGYWFVTAWAKQVGQAMATKPK